MSSSALTFNLNLKDYSFEISSTTLVIKEKNKDHSLKGKTAVTVNGLREIIQKIFKINHSITPATAETLSSFLEQLSRKIEQLIINTTPHYYLGRLIILAQKRLGIGIASRLQLTYDYLNTLPKHQNGTIAIKKIDVEKEKLILEIQTKHEALARHLGIPNFSHIEELQKTLNATIENVDLLEKILTQNLSNDSIALLIAQLRECILYKEIIERFDQICSVRFEEKPLNPLKALNIAFFIELRIFKVDGIAQTFFFARHTKLARNLQFDPRTRTVYLLAKERLSILKDEGTYKKLAVCLCLPEKNRSLNPEIATYLLTKSDDLTAEEITVTIADTRVEVAFCEKFRGVRGLAQLQSHTTFQDYEIPRMSLIFTRCTSNLFGRLFKDKRPITFAEVLTASEHLLSGLDYMHTRQIIHADLKLENALFNENSLGLISRGALCDFGFTFESDPATATINIEPPENFKWGQCGTVGYSPPELYGRTRFKGDFYKLDVWCMGCILYQLYFRKPLPWEADINENQKKFNTITKKFTDKKALKSTQATMKQKIHDTIEAPFAHLHAEDGLTTKEQYEYLIYKMMRLSPSHRIPIADALHAVRGLQIH